MRVIEPHQLNRRAAKKRKTRPLRAFIISLALATTLWILLTWSYYYRFLPTITPETHHLPAVVVDKRPINWPGYGQAALAAEGYGLLAATSGSTQPRPIASVAKVITALAVLEKHPINNGEQGPTITLTDQDVALYRDYLAKDGSVVPVVAGEKLSEYQALQALLLPSANNIADTLARWAFGSDGGYIEYANKYVNSIGLKQTKVAGASGFSGETVSTASDLAILGQKALKNPVIAEIVAQEKATLPVAGEVQNVNWLLGENGVNGIKTGNTAEAGGCYLVSAKRKLASGQTITVVAAIVGAPSLGQAISDAPKLLDSAFAGFSEIKVVSAAQKVGSYAVPWGSRVYATAKNNTSVLIWQGNQFKPEISLEVLKVPAKTSQNVGSVKVSTAGGTVTTPIVLSSDIGLPSTKWRLSHIWQ